MLLRSLCRQFSNLQVIGARLPANSRRKPLGCEYLNNYGGRRVFSTTDTTASTSEKKASKIKEDTSVDFSAPIEPPKVVRVPHADRDLRSHRAGVFAVGEGVVGESRFEFVDPKAASFPTLETMTEMFDGIPFNQLPILCIKCSKNNTRVLVTDYRGNIEFHTSCNTEGLKNAKKKTEVAGQIVGTACGSKLSRRGLKTVRITLNGLGPGRMSCLNGLIMAGVNVVSITDVTPLPELGPRPRKKRRI